MKSKLVAIQYFVRTDTEAEAPIFWPSDAESQFIGKDPDTGEN